MKPIDILLIAIVLAVIALAVWYIRREKKRGKKCIGCPDSGTCSGNCCSCQKDI